MPPNTEAASSHGQRLQLGLSGPQAAEAQEQSQLPPQPPPQFCAGGQGGQNPPSQEPPGQLPPGHEPPGQPPTGGQGGQTPPGQEPPGHEPPGQLPPGHGQGGQNPPGQEPPLLLFWHCCLKMPVPPGQKQLPKPPLPPQEGKPVQLVAIYHLPFLA